MLCNLHLHMIFVFEIPSCVLSLDSYAVYLKKNLTWMKSQLHSNYEFNTFQVNLKIDFFFDKMKS